MMFKFFLLSALLLSLIYTGFSLFIGLDDNGFIFFIYLVVLILFFLAKSDKKEGLLSKFSVWFILLFFLYSTIGPLFSIYFKFDFFPRYHDLNSDIYILKSSLMAFLLFVILFISLFDEGRVLNKSRSSLQDITMSKGQLYLLSGFSISLFVLVNVYFWGSDLRHFAFSGKDRVELSHFVNVDLWYMLGSISSMFTIFVFFYFYNTEKYKGIVKCCMLLSACYFFLDISVGGRKFFNILYYSSNVYFKS